MADEFLVSGESLVRNLGYGIEDSQKVSSKYKLGYLPDTFGHISQIPQILKKSGINHALIFRGSLSEKVKNIWEGADGTEVFAFLLPTEEGYFQPEALGENYLDNFKELIEKNNKYFEEEEIFILNGADHMLPSKRLNEKFIDIEERLGYKIKQITASQLVEESDFSRVECKIEGEQRDNTKAYILPGVTSTRNYLKKANQEAEDLISGQLEPFDVYTDGEFELKEYLDYMWRSILKNHAHDSICGCSIDPVHREMETRYAGIISGGKQLLETSLNRVYNFEPSNFNNKLYIINNHPIKEIRNIKAEILVPANLDLGSIGLYNEKTEISFDIIEKYEEERLVVHHDYLNYHSFMVYKVSFDLEFDGIEEKVVELKRDIFSKRTSIKYTEKEVIENERFKVEVNHRGSIDITDKKNGLVYRDLNNYISTLDRGDEYNYCAPEFDKVSKARLINVETVKGNTFKRLVLTYELTQPKGLDSSDQRASKEMVTSKIKTEITLNSGFNGVKFKCTLDNKGENHRLRISFSLGARIEKSYADTAFDVIERSVNRCLNSHADIRKEIIPIEAPSLSGVKAGPITFTHRGLLEYSVEEVDSTMDNLYITLLRAVGDLSKRELQSRNGGAGPCLKTPEAQCIREDTFEYVLYFNEDAYITRNLSRQWRIEPLVMQAESKEMETQNIMSYTNDRVALTAMKKGKDGSIILRFFNQALTNEELDLQMKRSFGKVWKCNLLEEEMSELDVIGGNINIVLGKKEILTLKIK